MISFASELATKALNIEPTGSPYVGEATSCTMCGKPIHEGDIATGASFGQSFNDFSFLRGTGYVCGHCRATTEQKVMRKLQRCVITEGGCYSLNKDEHRAWFLLNPPEPPFAVVINQSSNFLAALHMHWKTPVTTDKRVIQVNLGGAVLQLRHDIFLEAMGWCKDIAAAVNAARPKAKKKERMHHPFKVLNRDPLASGCMNNGVLLEDVNGLGAEHRPAVEKLRGLKLGELWALATMMKGKGVTPVRPDLVTSVS